MPTILAYQNIE